MLVSLLSLSQNTRDNQLKRMKGLFWLMVSQVSNHHCLAPQIWACGSTVHSRSAWQRKSVHLMRDGKQSNRNRRNQDPNILLKAHSQWSSILSLGLTFWSFHYLHIRVMVWRPSPQHMSLWTSKVQTSKGSVLSWADVLQKNKLVPCISTST
jgi:hypothetical protein